MAQAVVVVKVVQAVANASLVDAVRDRVVEFLVEGAKGLGKEELLERIARLRSDANPQAPRLKWSGGGVGSRD